MRNGQVQKFAAAFPQNVCWNTEHRLMHRFRLFVKKNHEQEQNRLHSITCKRECGKYLVETSISKISKITFCWWGRLTAGFQHISFHCISIS